MRQINAAGEIRIRTWDFCTFKKWVKFKSILNLKKVQVFKLSVEQGWLLQTGEDHQAEQSTEAAAVASTSVVWHFLYKLIFCV